MEQREQQERERPINIDKSNYYFTDDKSIFHNGRLSAVHVISKLHQALSCEQRHVVTGALLSILQAKEYDTSLIYNHLLQAGIVNALCLHLAWICNHPDDSKEQAHLHVDRICTILNLIVTKCISQAGNDTSALCTGPELFQFLLMALSQCHDATVSLPIISILHAYSKSRHGSSLLFQCRLVRFLPKIIPSNSKNEPSIIMEEYLGLLKNLSNFGGEVQCMEILEKQSLMMHLASIPFESSSSKAGGHDKILERLSAIIRNLAVSPTTRPFLAHHGYLLGAAARLGSHRNRHVQRNILSFFLSLAQDMDSCLILALYGDGLILNLLKKLLLDDHTATRRRAVRVVRLLAREAAGSQLARDSELIVTLSHVSRCDPSNEVRAEATDALTRLGSFLSAQVSWHHHASLLMNLASDPTMLPEVFSLALIDNSLHWIHQLPDKERSTFIECLASIALSTSASHECKERSCLAIVEAIRDETNRVYYASPSILQALVQNANATNHTSSQLAHPKAGIQGLIFLATVADNRKQMAVHQDLIKTLIRYATSTEDHSTKQDAKKAIVALVSEL